MPPEAGAVLGQTDKPWQQTYMPWLAGGIGGASILASILKGKPIGRRLSQGISSGVSLGLGATGLATALGLASTGPIGLVAGGLGLLSGLLSKSPEEQQAEQIEKAKTDIRRLREESTTRALSIFGNITGNLTSEAKASGRATAAATGRDTQAESFIAPRVGQAQEASFGALTRTVGGINEYYDRALAELSGTFPDISPTVPDTLAVVGSNLQKKAYSDRYIKALEGFYNPASRDLTITPGIEQNAIRIDDLPQRGFGSPEGGGIFGSRILGGDDGGAGMMRKRFPSSMTRLGSLLG